MAQCSPPPFSYWRTAAGVIGRTIDAIHLCGYKWISHFPTIGALGSHTTELGREGCNLSYPYSTLSKYNGEKRLVLALELEQSDCKSMS